ncbi:MAG TPA: DUF2304 domain-containing protein [Gemmatimonadetes bacterium]|nr:DUF2304 domain-containing protein [Gemmatimonadota bacterium]
MNLQAKLIVSAILGFLVIVLLMNYRRRRISTGQILLWAVLLSGAELLVLFPGVVDRLSGLWGNLIPVSWITFSGLAILILYLLYHTFIINDLRAQAVDLARNVTFLEERLRQVEARSDTQGGPPDA